MDVTTKQGRRSPDDRIIILRTRYGQYEPLSLKLLLQMIELFMQNEDRLHPRSSGQKGRYLILECIEQLANGRNFDRVAQEYLMPKHIKTAKKVMLEKLSKDEKQRHLDLFGNHK